MELFVFVCFFSFSISIFRDVCILYELCLHVCMCTACLPGAQESQKRTSDSLELELKSDLCLLEEQQVFLITETRLQLWVEFYVEILADIHKH